MSQTIDRSGSGRGVGVLEPPPTRIQIRGDDLPPEQRIGGPPWIVAKHALVSGSLGLSRRILEQMGLKILEDQGPQFHHVMRKQGWTRKPEGNLLSRQEFADETGRIRFVQIVDLPNHVAYIELR